MHKEVRGAQPGTKGECRGQVGTRLPSFPLTLTTFFLRDEILIACSSAHLNNAVQKRRNAAELAAKR